jgi:hypothetical protein
LFWLGVIFCAIGVTRRIKAGNIETERGSDDPRLPFGLGMVFFVVSILFFAYETSPRFRNWVVVLAGNTSESSAVATIESTSPSNPNGSDNRDLPITSAKQVIVNYYDHVNNARYDEAWAMLTDNYRLLHNPTGFTDFKRYWQTQGNVVILRLDSILNNSQANHYVIEVEVDYPMQSRQATFRFAVVTDATGKWLLDRYCDVDYEPRCSSSGL